MIHYRMIEFSELDLDLFKYFIRHQVVTKCWRKENDIWVIKDNPFIESWNNDDYLLLITELKKTIESNGYVFGAYIDNKLKAFASLESNLFGKNDVYADLSNIYVSEDYRNMGLGKNLFKLIKIKAKELGAKKLYISAHSSIESQLFYKKMGCVEAQEYNLAHVIKEPYDCQLECEI